MPGIAVETERGTARWRRRIGAALERVLPATLFGRLALLLFVTVLASHLLVLTLLVEFQIGPPHPPPLPEAPGAMAQRPPPWVQGEAHEGAPWPPAQARQRWHMGLLLDIGIRVLGLMVAAWIGARWLASPMRQLAQAASELGSDIQRPPLQEYGTTECRETSRVFNQMQSQIRQQLAERDRFVAAVSHDLRTPLTRLRLRAEMLADPREREVFCRDIGEMDAMITVTLDHLQGQAQAEPAVPLDVRALADALAGDWQERGRTVTVEGDARPVQAQAIGLRRCLGNLIENALRYGGSAEIALIDGDDALRLEVRDHGPGLAPEELEKVMAPFYRVEGSRNRSHGGVGLGLSIAHDIAVRHGGRLWLRNAEPHGLVATVEIPR